MSQVHTLDEIKEAKATKETKISKSPDHYKILDVMLQPPKSNLNLDSSDNAELTCVSLKNKQTLSPVRKS